MKIREVAFIILKTGTTLSSTREKKKAARKEGRIKKEKKIINGNFPSSSYRLNIIRFIWWQFNGGAECFRVLFTVIWASSETRWLWQVIWKSTEAKSDWSIECQVRLSQWGKLKRNFNELSKIMSSHLSSSCHNIPKAHTFTQYYWLLIKSTTLQS